MCKNCKNEACIGRYLLHPAEMHKVGKLKEKHLSENPNTKFELIESPSSGESFTKFMELHVIEGVNL